MSFKLSFSAYKLITTPFTYAYQLKDLGFDGWEIVSEGKQRISKDTLPLIKDIIGSIGLEITVHGPFSDLNPASVVDPIWNETLRQYKECIALSADFSSVIVAHPGILSPLGNQMPDAAWQRNREWLIELCDFAKDYGFKVCLENMIDVDRLFCKVPDEVFGMIDSIGHDSLGMTFDIGHANTMKNVDGFMKHKSRFSHVHLHDNDGVKDQHLAVGEGTIDWKKRLGQLKGYKGMMVIEGRGLEDGERSLRRVREIERTL